MLNVLLAFINKKKTLVILTIIFIIMVGVIWIQQIQINNYKQRYLETKANLDRMNAYIEKHPNLSSNKELDNIYRRSIPVTLPKEFKEE